jgi:hypothetical protein
LHWYGAQGVARPAGHVPFEHEVAATAVAPLQEAGLHETDGYVHAVAVAVVHDPPHGAVPAPTHAGRVPCGCPDGTCMQAPGFPVTSHAWHCPAHAELQQ